MINHQRNGSSRRPLAPYNFVHQSRSSPKHMHGNSNSKHLFNNNHTIPELIQIAHTNLAMLKPSLIAAFWNKVSKQMLLSGNSAMTHKRLPNHDDLKRRLDQIFQHTVQNLNQFYPIALSQTIYSMAKLVDVLRKNKLSRSRSKRGDEINNKLIGCLLLNSDNMSPKAELFHSFAIAAVKMIHQFEARNLSNIAYVYALIDYVPVFDHGSNLFDYIVEHALQRKTEFNSQEIANTLWAYAKANVRHQQLFEQVAYHIVSSGGLDVFNSQDIANTVWAYAKVDIPHTKLFETVANHIVSSYILDSFSSQALANTVWAYATADVRHEKLFETVANQIVSSSKLDRCNPQDIANTVWAFAKAGIPHPTLFEKVANHIVSSCILDSFSSQALANTVWAYATADVGHEKLFETVANQIVSSSKLDRYNPQALSNALWAYATVCAFYPTLFEKVANHIVSSDCLGRFNSQVLANTVWAYATADVRHEKLFETAANHIVASSSLSRFNPQELANVVWAYAKVDIRQEKLFEKVSNHIVTSHSLDRFNPQDFVNTVWAYATVGALHPTLFDKISNHIIESNILDLFNPQDLANTLWACASMGIANEQLFTLCTLKASKFHDSFNSQGVANMAWAFAAADVDDPTLFNDQFFIACINVIKQFEIEHCRQLYQWHLWRINEKSSTGLPEDLSQKCFEIFIFEEPTVSRLQADVVAQLVAIGLIPQRRSSLGQRLPHRRNCGSKWKDYRC